MDWIRGKKLGHGTFATVSLAMAKSQSTGLPPLMAVKSCSSSLSSSLMSEKLILDELRDCPEIITCFGDRFSCENGEKLYNVLLEYASGGTLADHIKNSGSRRLPEHDVRRYTKSLLKGLHYIHKFGYVHCDIKLQNILLCPNGVKMADFGLAKRAGAKLHNPGFELRGTPMYMSPEMVAGGDQGREADVWALGCAVAEMLTGLPAWRCGDDDVAGLLMRIGSGDEVPEIPGDLSDEGRDFLERCFVKSPCERWTAEMLLDHPFALINGGDDIRTWKDRQVVDSPRCPFDFPDWTTSSAACSITSLPLECDGESGERLRELVGDRIPDWSVSGDWITVR